MLRIRHINFILITIFFVSAVTGSYFVWQHSYRTLLAEQRDQLERFASHIYNRLDKYAHIPRLIAKDKALVDALKDPANPAQIDITNRHLKQVNSVIQASDTYLIDAKGLTIAASNWDQKLSFIGRNFAWRPYFKRAIEGNSSQYFALGSTSGKRGYYYSYPISHGAEILGVVVVKMDLTAIEENWKSKRNYFVATDQNQVIFMSSKPEWLFKGLAALSQETRMDIKNSRQYLDQDIRSLNLVGDLDQPAGELSNVQHSGITNDYIISSRPIDNLALNIRVLTPKSQLLLDCLNFLGILSLVFAIFYLISILLYQRQLKRLQFEQLQAAANQKLEIQVMERTAELHAEIAERIRTAQALKQTQNELIQAAKLAVLGQISASISHELNNPLAAIRSYADNGRLFLARGKVERTEENLTRIAALTERMARISEQLKSFVRKSDPDEKVSANLAPIILASKELVQPQLKKQRVNLELQLADSPMMVKVNPLQLEQVLINLLTNAMQALENNTDKHICLSVEQVQQEWCIHIDDNGPGISQDKQHSLFEPFYTTKKNGLGLGLSISQQIIKSMDGELSISTSPMGGARFSVRLSKLQG